MMRFTVFRLGVSATFVALSIITSLPCIPSGQAQQNKAEMNYEEAVIRWTYLKLMYYNSIANKERAKQKNQTYDLQKDIKIKIQNVHTGPIAEILAQPLEQLGTFPTGQVVTLTLEEYTYNGNRPEQVAYHAEWTEGQYTSTVSPKNMLFSEAFQVLGAEYSDIGKYSMYEVTVNFDGKTRTYKAIALFHGSYQSTEHMKPEFWDSIIGMGGLLTKIWNETRPPIGSSRKSEAGNDKDGLILKPVEKYRRIVPYGCDENQPLCCVWGATSLSECRWNNKYSWSEPTTPIPHKIPDKEEEHQFENSGTYLTKFTDKNYESITEVATSCNYFRDYHALPSMHDNDRREHDSGNHSAHTQVDFECKKTNQCVSTCDVYIPQQGYSDNAAGVKWYLGLYQPYHVGAKKVSKENRGSLGDPSTLTCKGGVGYAFNSCSVPFCAVDVNVSWGGATLQASGGDIWNVGHSREFTCSFPNGNGGGGSGGGGQTAQCGIGTGLYCYQGNSFCLPYTFPSGSCCCSMSPIVIDISRYWDWTTNSGNGYHFTDVAGGVRFDLNGDGVKEQVAWPTATSENAWLALDRNGNGVIDSGKELFGNFTDQVGPYGEPVQTGQGNGWLALAELDRGRSGGNENGMVDRGDAGFENLKLWVDRNHNGISEANELFTLASIGLTGIELNYDSVSGWTDQYGNNFKLRSRFRWGDRDDPESFYTEWFKDAWDVFPLWTP